MSKFTEAKLEAAIIELLQFEGYTHVSGDAITRSENDVLLKDDLARFQTTKCSFKKSYHLLHTENQH